MEVTHMRIVGKHMVGVIFSDNMKRVLMKYESDIGALWFLHTENADSVQNMLKQLGLLDRHNKVEFMRDEQVRYNEFNKGKIERKAYSLEVFTATVPSDINTDLLGMQWVNINDIDFLLSLPGHGMCYMYIEQARKLLTGNNEFGGTE